VCGEVDSDETTANAAGAPHVALIVETSMAYGREILHGVAPYIREGGPWTVYLEHRSLQAPAPPWLSNWDGDGIICKDVAPDSRLIRRSGVRTVQLNDQKPGGGRPSILRDGAGIFTVRTRIRDLNQLRLVLDVLNVPAPPNAGWAPMIARTAQADPTCEIDEAVCDHFRDVLSPKYLGRGLILPRTVGTLMTARARGG